MRNLVDRIEKIWCENMHGAPMWPMHGRYRCPKCMREYSVAFERAEEQRYSYRSAFNGLTRDARRAGT